MRIISHLQSPYLLVLRPNIRASLCSCDGQYDCEPFISNYFQFFTWYFNQVLVENWELTRNCEISNSISKGNKQANTVCKPKSHGQIIDWFFSFNFFLKSCCFEWIYLYTKLQCFLLKLRGVTSVTRKHSSRMRTDGTITNDRVANKYE